MGGQAFLKSVKKIRGKLRLWDIISHFICLPWWIFQILWRVGETLLNWCREKAL